MEWPSEEWLYGRIEGQTFLKKLCLHFVLIRLRDLLRIIKKSVHKGGHLKNVKIYFYIMTLLMVYLVPHISTLPGLLLAGVGVVSVGGTACLTWAFLGIKMQRIYEKHYKPINFILSLFLLYCAWDIVRG